MMSTIIPFFVVFVALAVPYVVRKFPNLPSDIGYAADFVIAMVAVIVVLRLVAVRTWAKIPAKYILVFAAFCYVVAMGIVVNEVAADSIVAGIRSYFKYVPLFLIPFAFPSSDHSVRIQLGLFSMILLVQIPVTIHQRFVEYASHNSGDAISGTFSVTGSLAMASACAICIVAAFYLDKRIRLGTAALLGVLFLLPPVLGETKATPILLAAGGAGVLFARRRELSMRSMAAFASLGAVLLVLFVLTYNVIYSETRGNTYVEEMTTPGRILENYNLTGVKVEKFRAHRETSDILIADGQMKRADHDGSVRPVGRFDSVRVPIDAMIADEKTRLLIGLGIGNVDSSFGDGAAYPEVKRQLGGSSTTLSILIWETGLFGALLFVLFFLFVAWDSLRLSSRKGLSGSVGAGVFGIGVAQCLSLIYVNMFHLQEILVIFSYVSGLVVSRLTLFHSEMRTGSGNRRVNADDGVLLPAVHRS